jgi:hypothetical protein
MHSLIMFLQALQSKPGSRGSVLGLDLDDGGSVGGREPVLSAKLMNDEPDVIVRRPIIILPLICSLLQYIYI